MIQACQTKLKNPEASKSSRHQPSGAGGLLVAARMEKSGLKANARALACLPKASKCLKMP